MAQARRRPRGRARAPSQLGALVGKSVARGGSAPIRGGGALDAGGAHGFAHLYRVLGLVHDALHGLEARSRAQRARPRGRVPAADCHAQLTVMESAERYRGVARLGVVDRRRVRESSSAARSRRPPRPLPPPLPPPLRRATATRRRRRAGRLAPAVCWRDAKRAAGRGKRRSHLHVLFCTPTHKGMATRCSRLLLIIAQPRTGAGDDSGGLARPRRARGDTALRRRRRDHGAAAAGCFGAIAAAFCPRQRRAASSAGHGDAARGPQSARLLAASKVHDAPFPLLLRELDVKARREREAMLRAEEKLRAAHDGGARGGGAPSACTSAACHAAPIATPPLALGLHRWHAKMRIRGRPRHARGSARALVGAALTFKKGAGGRAAGGAACCVRVAVNLGGRSLRSWRRQLRRHRRRAAWGVRARARQARGECRARGGDSSTKRPKLCVAYPREELRRGKRWRVRD